MAKPSLKKPGKILNSAALLFLMSQLGACTSIPDNVEPISNLDVNQYLGEWHEVARLDHSFERGLSQVSANYIMREDGGLDVINRGYSDKKQKWKEALGRAYFVEDDKTGHLKVSFFGPFYSSYIIFELGANYDYAFISGFNNNYLWLLSRTPDLDDAIKHRFVALASEKGFNVDELIWLDQHAKK